MNALCGTVGGESRPEQGGNGAVIIGFDERFVGTQSRRRCIEPYFKFHALIRRLFDPRICF